MPPGARKTREPLGECLEKYTSLPKKLISAFGQDEVRYVYFLCVSGACVQGLSRSSSINLSPCLSILPLVQSIPPAPNRIQEATQGGGSNPNYGKKIPPTSLKHPDIDLRHEPKQTQENLDFFGAFVEADLCSILFCFVLLCHHDR